MLNFLKRGQRPHLPDWRTDWLYALIFQQVEAAWNSFCKNRIDPKYWQYVLVEEWSSAEGLHCRGELLRSWMRNKNGLSEISFLAHSQHNRNWNGDGIYPFVIISFYVYPDRTHIVFCHQEADTAGSGMRYVVTGSGDSAKLEIDPSGGFWQS